jgi:hypothetical protein
MIFFSCRGENIRRRGYKSQNILYLWTIIQIEKIEGIGGHDNFHRMKKKSKKKLV